MTTKPDDSTNLKSFGGGLVEVDYENYLGQHDVVYLSPPVDGYNAMPIGNGDVGAMVWTQPEELVWAINKCDLWDDGPTENFGVWSPDWEEVATCLRSAGRLTISNSLPSYEPPYLEDYLTRLDLHKGTLFLDARTPFSNVKTETFVDAASRCLVIHYEDETEEATARRVSLARWGSRVYAHWYRMLRRDPEIGLAGTEATVNGETGVITQQTRSLTFAVACRVVATEGPVTVKRQHLREVSFAVAPTCKCDLTIYLSVATSEEAPDPARKVQEDIDRAVDQGLETIRTRHRARWHNFWAKSFIDIPDKYIENLWYLNLYILGSSSTGRYPPNNNTGIWTWNHDFRPWNHYYHWNNQYLNWPVYAAGHPELAESYLRMRFAGLEQAKKDARRYYNSSGALYMDVFERRGYQDACSSDPLATIGAFRNLTPGAQVALDCWRHYRYTGNEGLLQEIGYPIMSAACQLYLDLLQKEDDGRYHLPESHPYEHPCGFLVRDCITDLSAIKALFPATAETALKLGDADFAQQLNEVSENLVDYEIMDLPECFMRRDGETLVHTGNVVAGRPIEDPHMICAGRRVPDGASLHAQLWRDQTIDVKGINPNAPEGASLFPTAHDAPLFPFGVIGLKDRGTPVFSAAQTTTLANWVTTLGLSLFPITFARLGMGEEAEKSLGEMVHLYQQFPQGFWTEYPVESNASSELVAELQGDFVPPKWAAEFGYVWPVGLDVAANIASTDRENLIQVIGSEDEYIWLRSQPLMHFLFTPACVVQTGVSEMLLQSCDGVVRVAPAVPHHWQSTFALVGEGGLTVTGKVGEGEVEFVGVQASRDGVCRVEDPWQATSATMAVYRQDTGERLSVAEEAGIVEFPVQAGAAYLLMPSDQSAEVQPVRPTAEAKRTQPRLGHGRFIGICRGF